MCPGHKIWVRHKCWARGQTGKHLCRQQCVGNNESSFVRAFRVNFFPPLVRQRVNPGYRDGNRAQLSFAYERMEIFTKKRTARRDLVPARWTGLICLKVYALKEIWIRDGTFHTILQLSRKSKPERRRKYIFMPRKLRDGEVPDSSHWLHNDSIILQIQDSITTYFRYKFIAFDVVLIHSRLFLPASQIMARTGFSKRCVRLVVFSCGSCLYNWTHCGHLVSLHWPHISCQTWSYTRFTYRKPQVTNFRVSVKNEIKFISFPLKIYKTFHSSRATYLIRAVRYWGVWDPLEASYGPNHSTSS